MRGQTDGRRAMTNVMVAFQEYANASKMVHIRQYTQTIHSSDK